MSENILMLSVINMSIAASYVIIAVFVIRLLISRLPKKYSYILWSAVGLRLVLPFSFSSAFSIFNLLGGSRTVYNGRMEFVPMDIEYAAAPSVNTGLSSVDGVVNHALPHAVVWRSINPIQIYIFVFFIIWLIGLVFIVCRALYLHIKTKKLVRQAVHFKDNIYECDNIPTPFVMGIIRPKIYIPFRLGERERSYVISHEKHHIRRFDHIIKVISFILTAFHWFNPFVWLAYFAMNTDMEKSCDEWVISHMGEDIKTEYSESLLSFAANRRYLTLGPLAFGETSVKSRIKNVIRFKKPSKTLGFLGVALVTIALIFCITNSSSAASEKNSARDLSVWADAFCERDGQTIKKMADEAVVRSLLEEGLFLDEESAESGSGFGWSSPWPWGLGFGDVAEKDYKIFNAENGEAEILYYARTSDPHIFVWKETLKYKGENDSFKILAEKTELIDGISDIADYYAAYPEGIKNTPMDYNANGLGEYLNRNAAESKEYLGFLFDDECEAARYLLNLTENEETKINLTAVKKSKLFNRSVVKIEFDHYGKISEEYVVMKKPFGADGIWIPS